MELGDKLKELNLTADELDTLSKALKDDKFKEMLRDYAQEISDPDNKKKYEEEIKLLEQERGNSIEFIHPTPFRVIKTSEGGKQKCFINICTNEKVGKPEFKCVVSEDGRRGQCWSLPHTLHPGRPDTDAKGNKFMIYDVIYHPDTLYIASRNTKFMDIVDDTAIQGIQKAFKVMLDKKNVKEMRIKYKGIPQPCVIRKPIPGYKAKEPPEHPDPLAFPFPDEAQLKTKPVELPSTENGNDVEPKNCQIQLPQAKAPTKPNHTVKYRSFVDLQDFRCSRDSAQSPRPKEIVVTIDMPLLKSVTNTSLEVKEKSLLLESKNPAYRLELPLAYPVDEDKGEAKFNKQRRQLIVTLPVRPLNVAFDYVVPQTSVDGFQSDGESLEERRGVKKDVKWKERKQEQQTGDEEKEAEERQIKEHKSRVDKCEHQKRGAEQYQKAWEEEETGVEEKKRKQLEQKGQDNEEEGSKSEVQKTDKIPESDMQEKDEKLQKKVNKKEGWHNNPEEDSSFVLEKEIFAEENVVHDRLEASPETENQHMLIYDQHSSHTGKEKEASPTSRLESAPKMKSEYSQETGKTKIIQENMQVRTDAALQNHTSSEESQTTAVTAAINQCNEGEVCISVGGAKSSKISTADVAKTSNSGDPGRWFTLCSEKPAPVSVKENKEDTDEDDLSAEQIFQTSENKPPPSLLREIDADGNETVISDHSTSAGFIFQNKLMYELD
ncbi:protein kintoun [Melanotaenia boesemani]|uniref:protein kintoun n=1 Tax=Melanotaenia boesemani TaxID=1250792 RepID=UPI001C048B79|nr:protein kintoun [Melanotaenia boesemani]